MVVILARLLSPDIFGLVGAAMVFIGFAQVFSRLGIGPAIVQRLDLRKEHITTGFIMALSSSFGLSVIVYFSAPAVAAFFNMPDLTKVIKALSLVFPIIGASIIAEGLMQRNMLFKKMAAIKIISYIGGYGIIGIFLAFKGYGVWSLVFAQLVQATIKTGLLFVLARHEISVCFDKKAFRQIMYFGGGLSVAKIGNYGATRGDSLVVGRWLGADGLGVYSLVYKLLMTPANIIGSVLNQVLFPVLSSIQHDTPRLSKAYLRAIGLIAMITLPLSVFIIIMGPEIVAVLLGSEWTDAVVPLQVLAIGLNFRTAYKISDTLARSTGAVYRRAWRQWVYAFAIIGFSIVGLYWGVVGVAAGVTLAVALNHLLMTQLSLTLLTIGWKEIGLSYTRYLIPSVVYGVVLMIIAQLLRSLDFSGLFVLLTNSIFTVLLVLILIFPGSKILGEEAKWSLDLLKNKAKHLRGTK